MRKACFLDRDGVINVEVCYLHEPEKTELIPGITEALKKLRAAGYLAIVVTNQAGVAKGIFPEEDIARTHARIVELLAAEGAAVDDFFYCPHHPDYTGDCDCRKPAPGMIIEAARKWNIDLGASFLIGDRLSDIFAGRNAGLADEYLVMTGYGATAVQNPEAATVTKAENPLDAVIDFLSKH
ncbi:MAG: D-glycero-alpha-D-manno-heptose-1,7-bisphosphate 7-phosphatase [Victivallaceae bacterium]|nr:HAD family hydrolase [Victivallaceae bacterium]